MGDRDIRAYVISVIGAVLGRMLFGVKESAIISFVCVFIFMLYTIYDKTIKEDKHLEPMDFIFGSFFASWMPTIIGLLIAYAILGFIDAFICR